MPAVVQDVVCTVPFGIIFPINTNAPEVRPSMAPVNSIPPINDNVFEGRRATVLDDTERVCPELPQLPDDMPRAQEQVPMPKAKKLHSAPLAGSCSAAANK